MSALAMEPEPIVEFQNEAELKILIENVRSEDVARRKETISQIPNLILESLRKGNEILDQLLLVIYNLHTNMDNYEILNTTNRNQVLRNLLRLYNETIEEHSSKQIVALTKIINFVHSSELLVELAYVLHQCNGKLTTDSDSDNIKEALEVIRDKAAASLSSQALLMIYSIVAMK